MSDTKELNKFQVFLKEYVPYIIIIIVVLLIKKFIVSPIRVNGTSMLDTLHDGDIMILDIIGYRRSGVERFDIVVCDTEDEYIIKRVIGLPGEKIEYKNSQLYVNGKKVDDNYASKVTDDFVTKVPKNSYFVLGDNRTNSLDSRYYGAFSKKKILGKTKLTLFPFSRMGNKE